jgi:DNA helicase-2/ATP-dependent DNA helicase PcrA
MDFLDKLNSPQRKAVTAGTGPVLVLAGPGSGKTRVLTQRVAWLIASEGVRPYQILAVTFTNKAAREMEQRVQQLLGEDATQGMMLGTFHAICARLLRREAEHLPVESNFVIFDADDQERIVKSVIREFNLDEKRFRPAAIHGSISKAKNDLIGADDYPITNYRDEVVKRIFTEYQKRLITSNAVDFDDLLVYTARLLEDNPSVREKYARRFVHVLVDEFQDTNIAQYTLVMHLSSAHKNIFCVGDPDQCFPVGTQISTPQGKRAIETIETGDIVFAASGFGAMLASRVAHAGRRYFNGDLVKVTTKSGNSFTVTPNHIIFAVEREAVPQNLFCESPTGNMNVAVLDHTCLANNPLREFSLLPANNLIPSMIVAIEKYGAIIEDEIVDITREPYSGAVYDFEVENLHNYIAGGIVVHNSIYRWRGADWRNVHRFEQDYPDAQVILLEQNYRSRQNILDAAMSVIDRAQHRRKKKLFTDRGAGEKIFFYEAPDDYAEASFVVDSIAQLVASKQHEPGDCAVMYRTNAMSRLLEEAFLAARLPYRLVGAQRFYGRREVKDIICFLRLVHNPADEASLDRVINVPPRGIGEKTLATLHLVARQNNLAPGTVLLDLARGSDSRFWSQFTGRAALPLADFGASLANWKAAAPSLTVSELFDRIVNDLNYKAYIDDESEEGEDRWDNVQELKRLALDYSTRTLEEFLENVALVSDQDTLAEGNVPTLLTLHAAKGLEFGAVFIVGLDDGIMPHSRSFDDPESMEEERRLFYVGITRAKDRLYLLRAVQRGGRGYSEEQLPSRYLEDLPAELIQGRSRTGRSLRPRESQTTWSSVSRNEGTRPSEPRAARVIETRFRAGTRVKHATWGEGIVLDSRVDGDDELVDVVFESVGIKRLAASLANLIVVR